MKHNALSTGLVLLALVGILLSGCQPVSSGPLGPGAASPEAAVIQTVTGPVLPMQNFQINPGTVSILQKVAFNQDYIVVVSFRGIQTNSDLGAGPQTCLFTYQVLRARLGGWSTGSGGGSCRNSAVESGDQEPLVISGGSSGGHGPGDPGYSSTEGQVYQVDIVEVQVTWNDNQVQKVPVVNGTFIALRTGQFNMLKVEGLNVSGKVVYENAPQADPIKE